MSTYYCPKSLSQSRLHYFPCGTEYNRVLQLVTFTVRHIQRGSLTVTVSRLQVLNIYIVYTLEMASVKQQAIIYSLEYQGLLYC